MHNAHDTKATLVLGGTDKTGRRVTARLIQCRIPVRVSSRSGVPPFDWEDRVTWASARRDVGAVDVTSHDPGRKPSVMRRTGGANWARRRTASREVRRMPCANMATSGVWGTQR